MQIELRTESAIISGYVNVTHKPSNPVLTPHGEVIEIIEEGAFSKALSRANGVVMTVDHESEVFASTSDGTLELFEDNIGLHAKAVVKDSRLIDLARNNKFRGWSFGMKNIKDTLVQGEVRPLRKISDFVMDHITLVVDKIPVYNATSVEVRADEECVEYRTFENRVITEVGARAKPTYDNSEYHKRLAKIINEPYFMRYENLVNCGILEQRGRGNPYGHKKNGQFNNAPAGKQVRPKQTRASIERDLIGVKTSDSRVIKSVHSHAMDRILSRETYTYNIVNSLKRAKPKRGNNKDSLLYDYGTTRVIVGTRNDQISSVVYDDKLDRRK